MAFFDKLFEKKVCSACGGEIGLLGNRKLADGNLCKKCTDKLSPWFQDRRESTVAEIQAQLAYREENLRQLQSFKTTRVLGDDYKMYIEEIDGVPSRFYVSKSRYHPFSGCDNLRARYPQQKFRNQGKEQQRRMGEQITSAIQIQLFILHGHVHP